MESANLRMVTDGPRHGVHAVPVCQARIDDGTRPVEPSPEGREDSVDGYGDLFRRVERDVGFQQLAALLEEQRLAAIDHHFGDLGIIKKPLDGPQAADLVDHLPGDLLPELAADVLVSVRVEDGVERHRKLGAGSRVVSLSQHRRDRRQAKPSDQVPLEPVAQGAHLLGTPLFIYLARLATGRRLGLSDHLEHTHALLASLFLPKNDLLCAPPASRALLAASHSGS